MMTPTLLATLLAAAPLDPLAKMDEVQVTGWSADETKFSVRAFDRFDPSAGDPGMEMPECQGYVDHQGKKFQGRLVLAAYDQGKLIQSWLVQDYPECTPPDRAKATLTEAKAKFQELGIDLKARLSQLDCKKGCDLGHGATLVYENATKTKENDDEMSATLSGALRLSLKKGNEKTLLFEQKVKEEFQRMMGGKLVPALLPVEVSPSGKAVIMRMAIVFASGRGGHTTVVPAGYFAWEGDKLTKR